VVGNPNFEVIDIGKHVRNLKQFIKLRDTNPAFDEAKAVDDLGTGMGAACSIDGRGC